MSCAFKKEHFKALVTSILKFVSLTECINSVYWVLYRILAYYSQFEYLLKKNKITGTEDIVPQLNMITVRHMEMLHKSTSRTIAQKSSLPQLIHTVREGNSPPTTPTNQKLWLATGQGTGTDGCIHQSIL